MKIKINIKESKKCVEDLSLFIKFTYDSDVVAIIKALDERYYNPSSKEWEVGYSKLEKLVNQLSNYEIVITYDIPEPAKKENVDIQFEYKTKPYQHQIEAFEYGITNDKWLLADEMGLGKTKEVIDIAVAKKQLYGYKHCLIICGVNGLKWNWKREIEVHSNEGVKILGDNRNTSISNFNKLKDLYHIDEIEEYFLVTNVESLRVTEIVNVLSGLCKENKIGMVAFDECHVCKNPQSQQAKGLLKLSTDTMIAMTGTPVMNNPLDVFMILKWLKYEKHTFSAFRQHYCEMGGYGGYEVIGYKNMGELTERLNKIMLRRKKEEVLDLPEKVYIDEYVEMTNDQARIYREATITVKENIDKIEKSPNPLAELIRMRQATGFTGILSSVIQESAKLDRMEELVKEAVSNGTKVVIFSNWTDMTNAITAKLSRYNPLTITGETKPNDRQYAVDLFQTDPERKVMVGTIGAMGTGITLTAATVEIFLDEPWNRALKEQCIDRCHRIGQKTNLTIYTLMCKNTIDEKIHKLVLDKGEISDVIVDGAKANIKSEIIDFLLN